MTSASSTGPEYPKELANEIVKASFMAFRNLEPWYQARCEHEGAQKVITKLNNEVGDLCGTLIKSREVAGNTYDFSDEASDLFARLAETAKLDPRALEIRVNEVRDEAQVVKNGLEELHKRCRQHHTRLMTLSRDMNEALKSTQNQKKDERDARMKARNSQVNTTFGMILAHFALFLGVVPPVAAVAPVITLPAVLYIDHGSSHIKKCKAEIQARTTEIMTCEEAIKQLETGCRSLEHLQCLIQNVAGWWDRIDTMFGGALRKINKFQVDETERDVFRRLAKDFKQFQEFFLEYKVALGVMQAYFPEDLPKEIEANSRLTESA